MQSIKVVRESLGRVSRPVSEEQYERAVHRARELLQFPVHRWSGDDRDGRRLTVVWVAGPVTGKLFSAYEISGEA